MISKGLPYCIIHLKTLNLISYLYKSKFLPLNYYYNILDKTYLYYNYKI